jgi:hypothetical protein
MHGQDSLLSQFILPGNRSIGQPADKKIARVEVWAQDLGVVGRL